MMILKLDSQRGFSMVEMMVSVAASTIIAYSIYFGMQVGDVQYQSSQTKMTIHDNAREGLYKVIQEIRMSSPDQVTIGNGGNTLTVRIPDETTALNADFTVNWGPQIQYFRGGLNNSQLIRRNMNTMQDTVAANDVISLNFAGGANPNVVTVTLGVQRNLVNGQSIPATPLVMTGQAEIRNPES